MEFIINEFNSNLKIFVLLSVFFFLETFWPYFKFKQNRLIHTIRNIGLLVFYIIITSPVNYVAAFWYGYIDTKHLGLLNQFSINSYLKIFIGLLLLDCGDYFYHRLSHKSNLIWRFHKIHHSDMDMDSTTAFRFHPFDNIGLIMTEMTTAFIFGYGTETIVVYFLIYLPLLFMQHTNLKFPNWFEKTFEYIFATANFHRIHHSYPQHLTDSNYGAVFSFWDRLFGTYKQVSPEQLQLGLEDTQDDRYQTLEHLITGPFRNDA